MEHLRLLHGPQSGPHREPEPGPDQQVLHPRRGRDGDVAGERRQRLRQPAVAPEYRPVWHVDARQCEDWPVPAGTQQRSELFPERDNRYLGHELDCHIRLGSTPFSRVISKRRKGDERPRSNNRGLPGAQRRAITSVSWRLPMVELPTASQAVAAVHDTPDNPLPVAPAGLGVAWSFHAVPFHPSASVPEGEPPTAWQASEARHDTPPRLVNLLPPGLGVGWSFHAVPFHPSANVPELVAPTASQALAAVHDTPDRTLFVAPAGLGAGCSFHAVPFHASASVTSNPALLR